MSRPFSPVMVAARRYKDYKVTKADVMHEIRSNHTMTNKILTNLEEDGLIVMEREERSFHIFITRKGILHIREFNRFYLRIYSDAIKDHYKYRGPPAWARKSGFDPGKFQEFVPHHQLRAGEQDTFVHTVGDPDAPADLLPVHRCPVRVDMHEAVGM